MDRRNPYGERRNPLPAERLVGINADGVGVDNVTPANRFDVNKSIPEILINLMSENTKIVLHAVFIPFTREFPDIVMYEGTPYEVYNTLHSPPMYRECMVAYATKTPTRK